MAFSMVSITDFPDIPVCKLKKSLVKKVNESPKKRLRLLIHLDKFRDLITDELQFIRDTFPEFIPHDDKHHLNPLFQIADDIIGDGYKNFTFSELFLLVAGIYGHDWGMAISKTFKTFILNQSLPLSDFDGNNKFLSNERLKFLNFIKNESLMLKSDNNYQDIPDLYWQKFVRNTHAERSCYRVNDYFSKIDIGIGEAVAKICLGHSLEFQDLERPDQYPDKESVFNEIVNLKAITLYLRIIDLLDIGETRAPYTLLKFVMPLKTESKKHWDRNLAINSVSISPFSKGRQIQVRGETTDPEIFADLEELKNLFKLQIETTTKIFDQMSDQRHKFDIFYVDWIIKPNGFKGISIKFEFDRKEMFKILSSEIYQRDPFVFLRELLQNSIDAVHLKKEFYNKMEKPPKFFGYVKVDIEYDIDGKIIIKWYDNGIGMDEYIIKNYLSVIGKCFYEKSNLEKLGIKLDPISKFGIGILSCFYVANKIDIQTYKDPIINPDNIPLKIKIPEVDKQFRVIEISRDSINQGTQVTIFTDKTKFFRDKEIQESIEGKFTNYLNAIAGFVDFPIIITEKGKTTIIQHPEKKTKLIVKKYPNSLIENIDYNYPFSSVFLPQDVESAKDIFSVKILNIKSDLHLKEYEGAISFLNLPINLEWISASTTSISRSEGIHGIAIFNPNSANYKREIRWYGRKAKIFRNGEGQSKKSLRHMYHAIFKDGILLQDEKNPFTLLDELYFHRLPCPFFNVNILSKTTNEINLARTNLLEGKKHWFDQIDNAITKFFINTQIIPLFTKDKKERWYHIGRFLLTYPVNTKNLVSTIPRHKLPIVSLEKKGKIKFTDIEDITADTIYSVPEQLIEEFIELISKNLIYKKKYKGFLNYWYGNSCFSIEPVDYYPFTIQSICKAYDFSSIFLQKEYICSEITFLHPAIDQYPPLIQKIYRKIKKVRKEISIKSIFEKASQNPQLLTPYEINQLNQSKKWKYELHIPRVYHFQGPLSHYFAFGWYAINLNHPLSLKLIQIVTRFEQIKLKKHEQIIYGKIIDQLVQFRDITFSRRQHDDDAKKILKKILALLMEFELITDEEFMKFSSMENLFVPLSFVLDTYRPNNISNYMINPSFGKRI